MLFLPETTREVSYKCWTFLAPAFSKDSIQLVPFFQEWLDTIVKTNRTAKTEPRRPPLMKTVRGGVRRLLCSLWFLGDFLDPRWSPIPVVTILSLSCLGVLGKSKELCRKKIIESYIVFDSKWKEPHPVWGCLLCHIVPYVPHAYSVRRSHESMRWSRKTVLNGGWNILDDNSENHMGDSLSNITSFMTCYHR